jgi:stage II sporulation protein GA (sporulation sigma-E factor processing peptidase)
MDLLIFWIISKFCNTKIKFTRLVFGSLIIAILYCFAFFNLSPNIFIAIFILTLGILITFRPKNFFYFLKLFFLVHIIAFVLGGMATALFYYIDLSNIISNTKLDFKNFSYKILIASTCITFLAIKLFLNNIKKSLASNQTFYELEIFYNNKKVFIKTLLDTGHDLFYKNKSVVICELNALEFFFDKEIIKAIRENDLEVLVLSKIKFSFVSYKSLGKNNGILICFKPNKIKILCDKKNIEYQDVYIGICDFSLSENYSGLINSSLIK